MYYDLHAEPEDQSKILAMAKKLGWNGIGLILPYDRKDFPRKAEGLDVVSGIVIREMNANRIRNIVKQSRKKAELIIVEAGDVEFNRAVLNIPEIDVLSRVDNFDLDYVMCRLAAKNNVSIEISFHGLIENTGKVRSRIFSDLYQNARLIRKYKAPFVITSGAISEWDLRSPSDMTAFGKMLGFNEKEIKDALSGRIVRENRKRLSKNWLMGGVRIVRN
jgi:ribonuclease P/MRP protein subunit RPP1